MIDKTYDREVERFDIDKINKQARIPIICIYDHPTDYPEVYVARVWDATRPTHIMATATTLEALREKIPSQMIKIDRTEKDDPCIVEVWI